MGKVKNLVIDITTDVAEVVFDSVAEEGLLADLPVVGWTVKAARLSDTISDKIILKKIEAFLSNFEELSEAEKQTMRNRLEKEKERGQIDRQLVFILESANELDKAGLIGKCFKAYLEEKIERDDLLRLWHVIDKCFIEDLKFLKTTGPVNNNEVRSSLKNVGLVSGISIGEKGAHLLLTEMGCWLRDNILDDEN